MVLDCGLVSAIEALRRRGSQELLDRAVTVRVERLARDQVARRASPFQLRRMIAMVRPYRPRTERPRHDLARPLPRPRELDALRAESVGEALLEHRDRRL